MLQPYFSYKMLIFFVHQFLNRGIYFFFLNLLLEDFFIFLNSQITFFKKRYVPAAD